MPKRSSPAAVKNDSLAAAAVSTSRLAKLALPPMTLEALESRVLLTVTGYQPAVSYTTGANPRAIAAGDFTNNGRSDLVVVNQTSDTISVLMANANGTFQTPITLTDNASPNAVAIGDFLGNGDQDIAVTNQSAGTVSVYLGNGLGSFSSPATYSVGAGPDAIVSADLNNDGRDDLAIGTFTSGNVVVFLASSSGTTAANAFPVSPSNTYSLDAGINGIAAGALSTDGYKDLAVTNVGGTVTILHNDTTGNFTTDPDSDQYDAGISPEGVVIGNFREAGDIAIADNGDGTADSANVTLLLNANATGVGYSVDPAGPYVAGANPSSIAAATLNGQGQEDLAVTDNTDNTVSVLYNNNSGSGAIFAAPVTVATGQGPDAVATGDFTASGQIDLAVANKADGNASVLLHSSISITGQSQSATEGTTLSSATIADFSDNEANAVAGDFSATVDWGDGTSPTSATIQSDGQGGFDVIGSHTYTDQGVYTMSITVSDADNDSAQTTASTVVADAALTATAATFAPTAGSSFTGAVATFTDADPNGAAKFQANPDQYAAIIAWGDGHSTTGVITVSDDTFSVSGTHTYTAYGSYSAHVTIVDAGGSFTSTTSTANVADAPIVAAGTTITSTEGGVFSDTIGTFTDANTFTTASSFTATIHWGDGNTDTGTVIKTGSGQFSITGSHTYSDAGPYTLSFTVSDAGGSDSASTVVQVNNATLASAMTSIDATEGTSYTGNVATFTDSNFLASSSAFSAVITWSDDSTSTGTVSGTLGSYTVSIPGGHTFNDAGSQPVSVTITGAGGTATTTSGNANVINAALSGTLASVTAVEGVANTDTLATFTDVNTAAAAADFSATITWDDTTTSTGLVTATGTPGTYAVSYPDGHTFTRTGSVPISIAIAGAGGGSTTAAGNVTVDNATITATASTVQASNGNAFTGVVATFSDPNTAANGLDFTASIDWGDGNSGAGTIVNTGPGEFSVTGTHTWADPGTPTIAVTIDGNGGGTAGTSQNATVTDSSMTVTALSNSINEGDAFNGTIATFTDTNPLATANQFTSSIDWGDGSIADTTATITETDGVFSVVGTHSYTAAGSPDVTVAVSDNNSQTVNSSATMSVGYAAIAATLSTITATEGSPFSGAVATFTDANSGAPASEFIATVTFPGGNTTTATVTQTSPGNFEVDSGFTFVQAGSRPVDVAITDPSGMTTLATASGTAAVTSAGITVTGGGFECLQGFGRAGVVATFADAYSGSITPAGDYGATITWDDGTTSAGTITATGSGTYSITAGHILDTSGNNIAYSVSVTGPGLSSPATGTGYAAVDAASIAATMTPITATEGSAFTGAVGSFTVNDPNAANPAGDYTAAITWDDGTTTDGTVTATGNGVYSVTASHTFNAPGTQTENISITGPRVFSSVTASGTAAVANAGVTITGGTIAPTEGTPFSGTIATFSDANANTTLDGSDYTAAITWPDGSSDDATATALGGGEYAITDTHTFQVGGSNTYAISLTGTGLASAATAAGTATVTSAGITGGLSSINATEGTAFSDTIATFADSYSLSTTPASSYVATITWDDSSTSTGTITATSDGAYSITDTHTFQTPGSAAVSIDVNGPGLSSDLTITGNATVAAAELTVTANAANATEGAQYSNTIATFTSADSSRVAGDFTATVDWGDGSGTDSTPTIVAGEDGVFDVLGSHTYATAGTGTMTVNVTEGTNYQIQSNTAAVTVGYATVTPTIATITATEGTPFGDTIGTFTDSNTSAFAGEFAAQLSWDDGTTDAGTVTQIGSGEFAVTVSNHTFDNAGAWPVTLTIQNPDTSDTVAAVTANVFISNATLTASGNTLASAAGTDFSGAVASFSDPNTSASPDSFSATIDWGDGVTTAAVEPSPTSPGNFNIVADHQYALPGNYTIATTIDGAGGGTIGATSTMAVSDAGIAVSGNTASATEGAAYSDTIATFTDSDASLTASDFSSSIDWGDGSGADTSATIIADGVTPGLYDVVGTHTFDSAGAFTPTITVTHNSTATSNSGSASVEAGYAAVSATLSTITATEGTPYTGAVATFSDPNVNAPASEFSAIVTWPGDATSVGTVMQISPGNFEVDVNNQIFTQAGLATINVSITDPSQSTILATATGSTTIASAGITVTGGSISATQGSSFSGTIAMFADAYSGSVTPANLYTATINWDDGSSDAATITAAGGGAYSVSDTHTFHTSGNVDYTVSVTGPGMGSAALDTGSATVASAAITATMSPITATEGTPFTGTVATFSNADTSAANPGSDYTATITWPGGSTSTGTVTAGTGGSYSVAAGNTFNAAGQQPVSISIAGPGGAAATAAGNASITTAGLTASLGTITSAEGGTFSGTVATFTDADSTTTSQPGDYTALISWSAGTPVQGMITSLGGGVFAVSGSNIFTAAGNPSVSVSITGPAGGLAYAAGTAAVTSGTLTATASPLTVTEGVSVGGTIATFSNSYTGSTTPGSAFTATIDWGDGASMTGVVLSLGGGQYSVGGAHLYTAPGSYTVEIDIAGPGSSAATTSTLATVAPAAISATSAAIASAQGAIWTGTVATIHSADPISTVLASQYSATITWPDSSTSTGTITAIGGGVYTVAGSFAFSTAGSQTVQVAIAGPGNTTASVTDNATISGGGIFGVVENLTVTEGQQWTGEIAHFVSPNTIAPASAYTASITWEDGTTTSGQVLPDSDGGFDVEASHTFAHAGFAPVIVAITGPNSLSASVAAYEKVSSAALTIGSAPVSPVEGTAYTGVLAMFSDANTAAAPGDFTATITWSDNSTSAGTIAAGSAPGSFVVTSPHVFAHGGHYPLQVTITSADGTSASTSDTAIVTNAALTSTANALISVAGSAFAGTIGTFSDTNLAAYATDFIANISFGDGSSTTPGTIIPLGNGRFAVTGAHTYTRFGSYPISIAVSGAGGGNTSAGASATITNASLASSGMTLTEHKNVGFTTQIGTLYSANPFLNLADMTGTITWGDKRSSSVILQNGPGGTYEILGSHTYSALGKFNVSISLNEAGGGVTSVTSFITVNTAVSAKPPKVKKTPKPKKTKAPKRVKAPKKTKTKKAKKSDKPTNLPLAA